MQELRKVAEEKQQGIVMPLSEAFPKQSEETYRALEESQAEYYRVRLRVRGSFCGTSTGPFSEVEGLFTVLICIPCLEVRQAQPTMLLGLHDPGQPWEQWGCPIRGCGQWFLGPWYLEWHTARGASRLGRHL